MSSDIGVIMMTSLLEHNTRPEMDWLHKYGVIEVERDFLRRSFIIRGRFNLNGQQYIFECRIPEEMLLESYHYNDHPQRMREYIQRAIEYSIIEAIRSGPPVDQNNPSSINRRIFDEAWEATPIQYARPPAVDHYMREEIEEYRRAVEISKPVDEEIAEANNQLPSVKVRTFRLD